MCEPVLCDPGYVAPLCDPVSVTPPALPPYVGMHVQDRSTPLFVAAQEGHLGVLKALLSVHANMEAAKTESGTHACVDGEFLAWRVGGASGGAGGQGGSSPDREKGRKGNNGGARALNPEP